MIRRWLDKMKARTRDRLMAWLNVDAWRGPVLELMEARRACIAVDAAMHHDRGYVVMLMPRKGGDLVRVWEIPAGMRTDDQTRFIRRMEAMCRGEISLLDVPYPMREYFDYRLDRERVGDRPFQDHVPAGAYPKRGWPPMPMMPLEAMSPGPYFGPDPGRVEEVAGHMRQKTNKKGKRC